MTYVVYITGSFFPVLETTDSEQFLAFLDEQDLYITNTGRAKNGADVIYVDCERRY